MPTIESAAFHHLALGTDLVFVPRLLDNFRQYGNRFLAKLLTPEELAYCGGESSGTTAGLRRAAGKIAVKEAVSKALGTGISGLGWAEGVLWKDIEVLAQKQSPPGLRLTGRALKAATRLGIREWRVSLSHDGDYALATVIGLG